MSDQATPEAGAEEAAAPKAPNKLILPLVVAIMTIAGGAVGVMVIAPMLAPAHQTAALDPAHSPDSAGEAATGKETKGPIFRIDNLIVNPSGSQGSRFLMVSVAVETSSASHEEQLRRQEAQIRDVTISLLERETMESLSQVGIRDTLKSRLADTLSAITGSRPKLRVFLPQFVIQ
ncbi:MAG: flagellar basal body-associated FliL family protein [Gemmatimonadales bacterium]